MGDAQFAGTYSVLVPLTHLAANTVGFTTGNVNTKDLLQDPGVHNGDPLEQDPHITLHMGLNKEQRDKAVELCKDMKPFRLILGKFSRFQVKKRFDDGTDHEYDVLIREIISYTLMNLHHKLVSVTGKQWHHPQFKAHLTYAYLKYGTAQHYADIFNSKSVMAEEYTVEELLVKKFKDDNDKIVIHLEEYDPLYDPSHQ